MGRKSGNLEAIRAQFPSLNSLDWEKAFREDTELYGRVWRDILKVDQAVVGRPGPRPALDPQKAGQRYLQLTDDDFTMEPFAKAVRVLSKGMSLRRLAALTGLNKDLLHQLTLGKRQPDSYELEIVATAFGRRPSYFLEYRIGYVLSMVHAHMLKYPESSVGPYLKVRDKLGKKV